MIEATSSNASMTHMAGLVAHAAVLGPAGGDVGDRERVAVLPDRNAALVADQVDRHEARHRVVPLRPLRIGIRRGRTGCSLSEASSRAGPAVAIDMDCSDVEVYGPPPASWPTTTPGNAAGVHIWPLGPRRA